MNRQEFPELEDLLPLYKQYRQKWEKIGFCTTRIDRQNVTEAVKAAYKLNGVDEPKILFFDSPFEPWRKDFLCRIYPELENKIELNRRVEAKLGKQSHRLKEKNFLREINRIWREKVNIQLINQLANEWYRSLATQTDETAWGFTVDVYKILGWRCNFERILQERLLMLLGRELSHDLHEVAEFIFYKLSGAVISPSLLIDLATKYDFSISVLNSSYEDERWKILQTLAQNSNYIFSYSDTCFVCDRPIKFSLDRNGYLHAEGEPAILFADGFSIHACHGEIILKN